MILDSGLGSDQPVMISTEFGLVTAKFMLKNFKYALLIIVIAAAVVSPTVDAIGMLFWVAPMMALYVVSIVVAALFGRRQEG
ncbi:MAG: twin-arginine translocase subunit TatC [Acidobacteriota bacterium]|jgi:sec-independent protein translocase protein TatC